MKNRTVLFIGSEGLPVPASAFIKTQPELFREALEDAVQQLARSAEIRGHRAGKLPDGKWSIWLEDKSGDRHNFLLFTSQFEEAKQAPEKTGAKFAILGVWKMRGHAQAETLEFVNAIEHIEANFKGEVRGQLLKALELALSGRSSLDGTVEKTPDGVILRVLNKNQQISQYIAQIQLTWKD